MDSITAQLSQSKNPKLLNKSPVKVSLATYQKF